MFQSSQPLPHPIFPLDSSAPAAIFSHQQQQNPPLHSNISNGAVTHCSVDPLDTTGLCQNLNAQLPPLDGFTQNAHQVFIEFLTMKSMTWMQRCYYFFHFVVISLAHFWTCFSNYVQYPTFCEDDLQTIVQMGYGQNPNLETFLPQNFHGKKKRGRNHQSFELVSKTMKIKFLFMTSIHLMQVQIKYPTWKSSSNHHSSVQN